jgi:low affinity Fe/Cu permease
MGSPPGRARRKADASEVRDARGDAAHADVGGIVHAPREFLVKEGFRRFARRCSDAVASPSVFLLAVTACIVWAATGPLYHYSDTWQLVINTSTTIVTFLMVFLIQNTQNRDAKATHLKLDELLRAVKGARTGLVRLEDLSEEELETLRKEFERLHDRATGHPSHPLASHERPDL